VTLQPGVGSDHPTILIQDKIMDEPLLLRVDDAPQVTEVKGHQPHVSNRSSLNHQPRRERDPTAQTRRKNTEPRSITPQETPRDASVKAPISDKISVGFFNCAGGLFNKLEHIKALINKNKIDVLFVSECELKDPVMIRACSIEGFNIELSNKNEKSRLCCYIKSNLHFVRQVDLESGFEMIILDILEHRLLGFYRPFKLPQGITRQIYLNDLLKAISVASKIKNFIAGGDMNACLIKTNTESDVINSWLIKNDLRQLVKDYTRFRVVNLGDRGYRNERSLIDHIYSNILYHPPKPNIIHTDISDHELISIELKVFNVPETAKYQVRDWRKYNHQKVHKKMAKLQRTNDQLSNYDAFKQAFEILAPYRSIRIRENSNQIISTRIEKWKKKRDRLFKAYRSSGEREYYEASKQLSKKIKRKQKRKSELQPRKRQLLAMLKHFGTW